MPQKKTAEEIESERLEKEFEDLEKELQILRREEKKEEMKREIDSIKNKSKFILSDGNEAKMRKPKVKDVEIASKDAKTKAEEELILFGNLTGLTREELQDLDAVDYGVYQRKYQSFFL